MKFTDGYWCMKKEMSPLFAVEYADSRVQGSGLFMLRENIFLTEETASIWEC